MKNVASICLRTRERQREIERDRATNVCNRDSMSNCTFIHLNLSIVFRFRCCSTWQNSWLPSNNPIVIVVLIGFGFDIRTVELFSRQSIFIMSIAIYCSTRSRNDCPQNRHCTHCIHNVCACERELACYCVFLYPALAHTMSKITIEMNYGQIYQLIGFSPGQHIHSPVGIMLSLGVYLVWRCDPNHCLWWR